MKSHDEPEDSTSGAAAIPLTAQEYYDNILNKNETPTFAEAAPEVAKYIKTLTAAGDESLKAEMCARLSEIAIGELVNQGGPMNILGILGDDVKSHQQPSSTLVTNTEQLQKNVQRKYENYMERLEAIYKTIEIFIKYLEYLDGNSKETINQCNEAVQTINSALLLIKSPKLNSLKKDLDALARDLDTLYGDAQDGISNASEFNKLKVNVQSEFNKLKTRLVIIEKNVLESEDAKENPEIKNEATKLIREKYSKFKEVYDYIQKNGLSEQSEDHTDTETQTKSQAEAAAKTQAEADATAKAKAQAEADATAKAKAEADATAKAKAEAEADATAKAKAQTEADATAKAQADATAKARAATRKSTRPDHVKADLEFSQILNALTGFEKISADGEIAPKNTPTGMTVHNESQPLFSKILAIFKLSKNNKSLTDENVRKVITKLFAKLINDYERHEPSDPTQSAKFQNSLVQLRDRTIQNMLDRSQLTRHFGIPYEIKPSYQEALAYANEIKDKDTGKIEPLATLSSKPKNLMGEDFTMEDVTATTTHVGKHAESGGILIKSFSESSGYARNELQSIKNDFSLATIYDKIADKIAPNAGIDKNTAIEIIKRASDLARTNHHGDMTIKDIEMACGTKPTMMKLLGMNIPIAKSIYEAFQEAMNATLYNPTPTPPRFPSDDLIKLAIHQVEGFRQMEPNGTIYLSGSGHSEAYALAIELYCKSQSYELVVQSSYRAKADDVTKDRVEDFTKHIDRLVDDYADLAKQPARLKELEPDLPPRRRP